jgi:hypothetical protein
MTTVISKILVGTRWREPVIEVDEILPFLTGDDSQEALDSASRWMYANFAGFAYGEYLSRGRGFLMSPFARDRNGIVLSPDAVSSALTAGEPIQLICSYIAINEEAFKTIIPEDDIRDAILPSVESYDPKREIGILLLRTGNPFKFLPAVAHLDVSPVRLYEAALESRGCREQDG